MVVEGIGSPFNDLEDIGVVEGISRIEASWFQSARDAKVFQPAGGLTLVQGEGYGDLCVGIQACIPEMVSDLHAGKGHRGDGVI